MKNKLKDHNSFLAYWLKKNEFNDYLKWKKELYNKLIIYIENENFDEKNYENLISFIEKLNIMEKRQEFIEFLKLISKICKNYKRSISFLNKIEQIILKYDKNIRNILSNDDIFNIFKNNKYLLLFLIKKSILTVNQQIVDQILEKKEKKYHLFFSPEIKSFVDLEKWTEIENELLRYENNIFDNFERNRQS